VGTSARSSLTLLAGAGLTSAIICLAVPGGGTAWLLPGAIFAITIIGYLALFERYRSRLRFLAFLCACSASYPLSMLGAFGVGILFHSLIGGSSQSPDVPLFYLFIGGGVGACIVLFSGVLLFGSVKMSRKASGAALLCAISGGILGLLGGEIDRPWSHATQWPSRDIRSMANRRCSDAGPASPADA
jgi:hypothetical protein